MSTLSKNKYLFAGGGTGGHLFPAIAVADKLKELDPGCEILFIGTKKKIEAKIVPALGYQFKTIWIKGFARKITLSNLLFPLKLIVSMLQSNWICKKFSPDVAIGSGGYVSGPAIMNAAKHGAKIVLLEQNSLPGKTTLMLEKYASKIFVSFEDSKKYFKNKDIIISAGNPVRSKLQLINKEEAKEKFGFDKNKKVVLVLGGSLGARSINNAMIEVSKKIEEQGYGLIWQCGSIYYEEFKKYNTANIQVKEFIEDMSLAYSAADLLISRAGATTLAEITSLGIPSVLIPSPNVAENHQFFNAKSMVDKDCAILVEDKKMDEELFARIKDLFENEDKLSGLKSNIANIKKNNAAQIIAEEVLKLANESKK